ncbi:hypothetical protein Aph01nite_27460 [Acrocarpospora phusangensis]|uniref:Glycosyl hydrolase family 98 putative carbohydrate-binding module domain-containing protein n=1 Tax=Acrocarpospora phusangensis TaxID=1070424 RepID=A0A919UK02_9ACTN|nr:NPCBM/NEW2 domain-containing protein [Acrocarpospora phusangensis]GIH24436.1 hypothetical protein Aph01nite_27460 [Acrocarpospora phusangensis]
MTANLPVPYQRDDAPKSGGLNKIAIIVAVVVTAVAVGLGMYLWGPVRTAGIETAAAAPAPTVTVTATATETMIVSPSISPSPAVIAPLPGETTPAPAATATGDDVASAGPLGSSDYLTSLDMSEYNGQADYDALPVNGQSFLHSVGLGVYDIGSTHWAEYTVDGRYKTLVATLGVNDVMSTDTVVEFTVLGNGRELEKKRVKYAQQVKISVPVEGNVKLRIAATRVGGEGSRSAVGAVWGDASLTR